MFVAIIFDVNTRGSEAVMFVAFGNTEEQAMERAKADFAEANDGEDVTTSLDFQLEVFAGPKP